MSKAFTDLFHLLFGYPSQPEEEISREDSGMFTSQPVVRYPRADLGYELRRRGLQVTHIHPNEDYGGSASRNVTTVVYEPRRDEKHTIRVATSVCSEHDTFSKKAGVLRAIARWDRGERVSLPARVQAQTDHDLLASYFS